MTCASADLSRPEASEARDDRDAEERHLHDLVFLRNLFAARGATRAELQECDRVIGLAAQAAA